MKRTPFITILMAGLAAAAPLTAARLPDTWEGLYKVRAKGIEGVYLRPQADFRGYAKVVLEPTEVAFRKDWQRDHDDGTSIGRVSDTDARRIIDKARDGLQDIFRKAYEKAGYQVVTAAGPDVLRILTAVVNLDVDAPDLDTPGITRTFSRSAGGATLVVEARDSLSGELLGRALDARGLDESAPYLRNRATNAWAFEALFEDWAKRSAEGLTRLKALSPIDTGAPASSK